MARCVKRYLRQCQQVSVVDGQVVLIAPSFSLAEQLRENTVAVARWVRSQNWTKALVFWENCIRPYEFDACLGGNDEPTEANGEMMPPNSSGILVPPGDSNYQRVTEFMQQKRSEGLIVTITSMLDDRCLHVNDLQAPDRGVWQSHHWIGLNFRLLWRDSFTPGQTNYYQRLIDTVCRDKTIREFEYELRRPSGALARYYSDYYYFENYLDTPVRVCVSQPGNWEIISSAEGA